MLILVFEVIVQPLKTHFLTFSSETKIKKIIHSANAPLWPTNIGSYRILLRKCTLGPGIGQSQYVCKFLKHFAGTFRQAQTLKLG